jgi:hypothetical protein
MRRPARPFTVEIKSSRKPVSIRTPASIIPDRPGTEPLPRRLLFEDAHQGVQLRSPAQDAALSEARSVFSRLGIAASGPAQSSARLRIVPQGPEREAGAPEQPQTSKEVEPRQARILPDLLSLSRASDPLGPEAEKRTGLRRKPQSSETQERVEPETEQFLDPDHEALLDAGHEPREPAEMERPAPTEMLEIAAAEQGALPLSTSPEGASSRQGRGSREVCPGWVYRAACRKAKRRGEPLPQRASVRWKRRSRQTR